MKVKVLILYFSLILISCNTYNKERLFINEFVNTKDYNLFFKNRIDDAYFFVIKKGNKFDYNLFFKKFFQDYKKNYSFLGPFHKYKKNGDYFLSMRIVSFIHKKHMREAEFIFKKNKYNKWILYNFIP